jgi:hypothetical protein
VGNIAGYVYDHTRCDARRWRRVEAGLRGPYFVSAVNGPRRDEFLKFVRLHIEKKPGCDPLDGQVHGLEELTRWIGIRELALRFIGLGVILGVFQLAKPWIRRDEENHEDMVKRLKCQDGARFRLTPRRPSSIDWTDTRKVSQSFRSEKSRPIIITSSAELDWVNLPSSSTTTFARHRPWSPSGRRPTCSDSWPTVRSDRIRRG